MPAMNSKHSSGRFTAFVLLIVFACSSVLASVKPTATDPNCPYPEPNSHAFWVLGCGKPVLVERADPIQYPGVASQHLHTIMGGNAFDFDLDYDKTQASTCTTCSVTKDLSNYWVPTVYFHAENGSFISVPQVGGLNVYYQERLDWTEYCAGKTIEPFPRGFRMIAGDQTRRSFDSRILEHQAIEFICLPANGQLGVPAFHGFPNRTCDGGLQLRVRFPSCWDGVGLDSPNHQSHMAYPSRIDTGSCPDSHPRHLPSLLYEVTWSITEFNHLRKRGDQPFVLSHGDPTGFGYHGDFLNGWDVELLRTALKDPSCGTSSGGQIHKCRTFQPFLQDGDEQNQCRDLPGRLQETVTGVLSALPGCNRLQYGPENAVVETCDRFSKSEKPAGSVPSPQSNDIPPGLPGQSGQQGEGSPMDGNGVEGNPPAPTEGSSTNGSDGAASDSDEPGVVVVEEVTEVTEHTEVEGKPTEQPMENSASSCRRNWVGAVFRYWRYQMNGIQFAMLA